MQVAITARVMYHDKLGRLNRGRVVELPDRLAEDWLRRGFAERYETKVMRERPSLAAGEMSSASQAAPVSQPQTLNSSDSGAKPRRRKARAESS